MAPAFTIWVTSRQGLRAKRWGPVVDAFWIISRALSSALFQQTTPVRISLTADWNSCRGVLFGKGDPSPDDNRGGASHMTLSTTKESIELVTWVQWFSL
jgi:hypothetical protein